MTDTALAKLDKATQMLAEVKTIDEAKKIVNLAEAARVYAREAELGLEAQNHAAEIKLRAQRRAGELLERMYRQNGGRPEKRLQDDTVSKPTLSDLGISKADSSRWQRIAQIPTNDFERFISETKGDQGEITTVGAIRLVKEIARENQRAVNADLVAQAAPLPRSRYKTLVIDPPWDFSDEGDVDQFGRGRPTYATMSIDELISFPISNLSEDDAHLYLWITNRSLPKGFDLLEMWGFRYVTCLTWCKPSIGMGNYFRGSTEQILFGVRGSLPLLRSDVGTWFQAQRGDRHSAKPDEFYKMVETCSPGPWIDIFARDARKGWAVYGAETNSSLSV